MLLAFIFIYQTTSGPVAWLYATETSVEVAMGFIIVVLWMTVLALTLISPYLMEPSILGPSALFYIFASLSLLATVFM